MNDSKIFDQPALVLIDARTMMYSRYRGTKLTVRCQSNQLLEGWEVELYRVDPAKYLGHEVD